MWTPRRVLIFVSALGNLPDGVSRLFSPLRRLRRPRPAAGTLSRRRRRHHSSGILRRARTHSSDPSGVRQRLRGAGHQEAPADLDAVETDGAVDRPDGDSEGRTSPADSVQCRHFRQAEAERTLPRDQHRPMRRGLSHARSTGHQPFGPGQSQAGGRRVDRRERRQDREQSQHLREARRSRALRRKRRATLLRGKPEPDLDERRGHSQGHADATLSDSGHRDRHGGAALEGDVGERAENEDARQAGRRRQQRREDHAQEQRRHASLRRRPLRLHDGHRGPRQEGHRQEGRAGRQVPRPGDDERQVRLRHDPRHRSLRFAAHAGAARGSRQGDAQSARSEGARRSPARRSTSIRSPVRRHPASPACFRRPSRPVDGADRRGAARARAAEDAPDRRLRRLDLRSPRSAVSTQDAREGDRHASRRRRAGVEKPAPRSERRGRSVRGATRRSTSRSRPPIRRRRCG